MAELLPTIVFDSPEEFISCRDMQIELGIFFAVLAISYVLAPKQGDLPKVGYELIVTLLGQGTEHTFHIHHWIYLFVILFVGIVARSLSKSTARLSAIAITAIIVSEFLKYSDVLRL